MLPKIYEKPVTMMKCTKIFLVFLFSFIPKTLRRKICSLGFPELFKEKIVFSGKITGTNYLINARTDHPIESNATRLFLREPLQKQLLKTNFSGLKVLDVGANVGVYTLVFCNQGAQHVFAIEPGPLVDDLKLNIRNNTLEQKVSVSNLGISSNALTMYWHEDLNNLGNAHLFKKGVVFDQNSTLDREGKSVLCESLDDFWNRHHKPRIDFIKIDVEGMELEVLRSGENLITKFRPVLLVETHNENKKQNHQICEFLQKLEYDIEHPRISERWSPLSNLPNDTLFQYNK